MKVEVRSVVDLIQGGYGIPEVLAMYPSLDREDIAQALQYAQRSAVGHPISGGARRIHRV